MCSRKRDQQVVKDGMERRVSGRYGKSGSSKWLVTSFSRPMVVHQPGVAIYPSLMELCIDKIGKGINQYGSFAMLPKGISQHIFNKLVLYHLLTDVFLQKLRDCAHEIPGRVGSGLLKECSALTFNHCENISEIGLKNISVFKNLQSLEICGGVLTDAGVKNIKDLASLTLLNLSQNCNLTNKSLELISENDTEVYMRQLVLSQVSDYLIRQ